MRKGNGRQSSLAKITTCTADSVARLRKSYAKITPCLCVWWASTTSSGKSAKCRILPKTYGMTEEDIVVKAKEAVAAKRK